MPRPALHAAVFLLGFALSAAAAPPEVTKVEPPSWWPGHSIDPVRLLVRGQNLAGAEVTVNEGVRGVEEGLEGQVGEHLQVPLWGGGGTGRDGLCGAASRAGTVVASGRESTGCRVLLHGAGRYRPRARAGIECAG